MRHLPEKIIHACDRTHEIIPELKRLRGLENPTDDELRQLVFLTGEFHNLNPFHRFAWVEARPAIDIYQELLNLERRMI